MKSNGVLGSHDAWRGFDEKRWIIRYVAQSKNWSFYWVNVLP